MKYSVKPLREAGLEAKWSKSRSGQPYIVARNPKAEHQHMKERWWIVDNKMFERMQEAGIVEGFDQATLLGDIFSI
jgi:hypothetical protein